MTNETQNWQDLARLASEERDPDKLIDLVRRLNLALDESDSRLVAATADGVGPALPNPNPEKIAESAA